MIIVEANWLDEIKIWYKYINFSIKKLILEKIVFLRNIYLFKKILKSLFDMFNNFLNDEVDIYSHHFLIILYNNFTLFIRNFILLLNSKIIFLRSYKLLV